MHIIQLILFGFANLLLRINFLTVEMIRFVEELVAAARGLRAPGDRPIPGQQGQPRIFVTTIQGDVGQEIYGCDSSPRMVPF